MSQVPADAGPSPQRESGAACVPCLRLRTEVLMLSERDADGARDRELALPVIDLSFDYGGVRVAAADPAAPITRDAAAERQARYLLESFGVVELACLDDLSAAPGSAADYVVRP